MSRADVLMCEIRESIATINGQKDAESDKAIELMEDALTSLTKCITALGDIPKEEVIPHKEELIGIMSAMNDLTDKIESAKIESKEAVLDIMRKIKAQQSYNQNND